MLVSDGSGNPQWTTFLNANKIASGGVSNAQFNRLSAATSAATADTLVLRDSFSGFEASRVNESTLIISSAGSTNVSPFLYKNYYLYSSHTLTLPDATSLNPGWVIFLFIESGATVILKNNSGTTLDTLGPSITSVFLQTGGFQNGTWRVLEN